jgi:hypothetical protein
MKGAGGGKRNGRKSRRVESDDRPRGYESTRMRQLWRDIDDAKHKAGIGSAPASEAPPQWDLAALFDRATALVGGATTWMSANAPIACALLATGTELLRSVPVVGRLVDLVPTAPKGSGSGGSDARPANGSAASIVVDPVQSRDPDGGWVH